MEESGATFEMIMFVIFIGAVLLGLLSMALEEFYHA